MSHLVSETTFPPAILVTGTHRSGTTWVGEMLALSQDVHYIHEPFAPMYERSWLPRRPISRYLYLPPESQGPYERDLDRILSLSPNWLRIGLRARGLRNWVRLSQEAYSTSKAKRRGARPLVKDPFLLLSAEWFVGKSGALPVILVRHPAAFVSSVKRLGWRLDLSSLLSQPELIERLLGPYENELRAELRHRSDIIDHACIVWRVLNSVVRHYEQTYPHWCILRYEDIAANPISGFSSLYTRLGIPWSDTVCRDILRYTSKDNPSDVSTLDRGSTRRNSVAAMWTWLDRLNEGEIERIKSYTNDIWRFWYDKADWPS